MSRTVRIGGASGYWGDSAEAPKQFLLKGEVDYLAFDYLAEVTMSILARARARSEDAGYALDFVTMIAPLLPEIAARGVKVGANAGGVNLDACRRALEAACSEAGVSLAIGTVEGDDLLAQADDLRDAGVSEMRTGAALPGGVMSVNAYLGAFPIAAALDAGADIVVTGRCVDSACVLGPLIHEFGWTADDLDKLAQGSLAGHLLECGAQATGGNFTDWRDVAGDWADMGYPIAEVTADGSFVVGKPAGTGGLVSPLSVGEQMLYEIGDPAAYLLPDVACDFTAVEIVQSGEQEVTVTGARGRAPGEELKVCATYRDGYKCAPSMLFAGFDAVERAEVQRDATLARMLRLFDERGLGDFSRVDSQIIGAESLYGAGERITAHGPREVLLRLSVQHPEKAALELFARELVGNALAMSTGRSSLGGGRAKVQPLVRAFSFLLAKDGVPVTVRVGGQQVPYAPAQPSADGSATAAIEAPPAPTGETAEVPLIRLAVARSGDKGNDANVGVIARKPEYLGAIRAALTPDRVKACFAHFCDGEVERFDLPGIHGLNFLLRDTLGGGGMASIHLDAQAKTYAQILLDTPIPVPKSWMEELNG